MDLVLFGRQGSGKGTQGKFFTERYGLTPFVTGDELRKLAALDSELGRKIKSIIEAGHLVPNEVVMEIIENFMNNLEEGKSVLFDGIPRKMEQAESFNALMKKLNREFSGVLIEIGEKTAIFRLTSRRMCAKCKAIYPAKYDKESCEECGGELETRQDDANMDAIRTRLDAYENETVPAINMYREMDKIIEINGEQDIEVVNQDAFAVLDPLFGVSN
ncbi:AAA family ATPase [Candidatus Peregrinibacteria bacterium]|nr:AAA family ATPase [Candidatus Peregrinibacteria bacterium]MBT7484442.1 AAA family ATPase [Candidatus Peregrinibacteria bacterium]MBT7703707.1 AAA family ATPase [Candidatus Peregrinibacteria bacterium]